MSICRSHDVTGFSAPTHELDQLRLRGIGLCPVMTTAGSEPPTADVPRPPEHLRDEKVLRRKIEFALADAVVVHVLHSQIFVPLDRVGSLITAWAMTSPTISWWAGRRIFVC
jgi:hypothetical protein